MPVYDKNLELIPAGSAITRTTAGKFGAGILNAAVISPGQKGRRVMVVNFSAFAGTTPTMRFYVVVSYDNGTTWKKVAVSAQYQTAALSGGDATSATSIAALGVDPAVGQDVISASSGFVRMPFDFVRGRLAPLVALWVEFPGGTSPTVTVNSAYVSASGL